MLNLLPLSLLLLYFSWIPPPVDAAQQCRLVLKDSVNNPSIPDAVGPGSPNSTSTVTSVQEASSTQTGSNTRTGGNATPTRSTSASPSFTPFNYGTDKIRGVNLYVLSINGSVTGADLCIYSGVDGSYWR
jgi:hypothetical protein